MPAPTYPVYAPGASGTSFADESPQGGFLIDFPFGERKREAMVIRQRFLQLRASYVRPDANALNCSAYPSAYFCNDEGFADVGMGLTLWTRVWATIPEQITDFETYAYTFPGYAASISANGRVPLTKAVTSKLTIDFYLVGPSGSYATADLIPAVFGQTYTFPPYIGSIAAEYLDTTSVPTLATYEGWVTTDAAGASSYSIEAADSVLENYIGNIWRRTRRKVKAR
jgi:hypothetical protein